MKRLSLCLLLLLLVVAFYDVIFLNRTFKVTTANSQALPEGVYGQLDNKPPFIPVNGTDSPVLEEPVYEFIKRNLRQGILPLWNPHQATGYPLIGMLQTAMFYPLTAIMYLFPSIYAWDLMILARFFLAGAFMYWFMRAMGFSRIPSFCAGLTFMLSGPMVLLQYWTVNVDILAPVLMIAADRLIRNPGRTTTAFLGLVVGLTILGGHPEHIFLVNAFGAAFFIFRLWQHRKETSVKKTVLCFFGAYLLGAGLSAIALFPFIRNLVFEFWHGHPDKVGLLMEEQRVRAITLALPHFFQKAPVTYQWSFAGWWGGYLGAIPLGLAFLSCWQKQKRGLNYFFAAAAAILIGKEYGLPVINWLGYLPLFDLVRYAIHSPHLAALCVAVLAGMGVRMILCDHRDIFKKGYCYSAVLLCIALIHLIVLRSADHVGLSVKATLFALGLLVLFQGILWMRDRKKLSRRKIGALLAALLFLELFLYIHRERPRRFDSFAKVPYIEILKGLPGKNRSYGIFWAFYPNTATGFGVDDLGYFFGLVPKRFVHFVNALLISNHFRNDLRPPALRAIPIEGAKSTLDLLNVQQIITPDTKRMSQLLMNFGDLKKDMDPIYEGEANIYRRNGAYPRAFVVHRAVFEPDQDKSLEILKRIGGGARFVAVINEPAHPKIALLMQDTPQVSRSAANIVRYTPNEVVIQAAMRYPGFVVFSDAYHPDWKCYVGPHELKVFRTDYLLRSVFLPAGTHEIRFVFRPASFTAGCWVSLLSGLLLAGLWAGPKVISSSRLASIFSRFSFWRSSSS